jgi:hypothetical protein
MRVQSNTPVAPVARLSAGKAPAAKAQAPAGAKDSLALSSSPAMSVEQAKKAIADLANTPSIPLSNAAKKTWLETEKKRQTEAEKANDVLSNAWMDGKISMDDLDKLTQPLQDHADKIARCEERAGLTPLPKPLNPFRPLFGYTNGLGNLPNNALGGIVAAFGIMVAIPLDIVDAVTRPVQAVLWPVAWGWRGIQQAGHAIGIG